MASSAPRDPRDRGAYARQVVVEYLRKCGYNSTEKALHAEASAVRFTLFCLVLCLVVCDRVFWKVRMFFGERVLGSEME